MLSLSLSPISDIHLSFTGERKGSNRNFRHSIWQWTSIFVNQYFSSSMCVCVCVFLLLVFASIYVLFCFARPYRGIKDVLWLEKNSAVLASFLSDISFLTRLFVYSGRFCISYLFPLSLFLYLLAEQIGLLRDDSPFLLLLSGIEYGIWFLYLFHTFTRLVSFCVCIMFSEKKKKKNDLIYTTIPSLFSVTLSCHLPFFSEQNSLSWKQQDMPCIKACRVPCNFNAWNESSKPCSIPPLVCLFATRSSFSPLCPMPSQATISPNGLFRS